MTFLELQHKIEQTRKARRGVHHSTDRYADGDAAEEAFDLAVYKKALGAANVVVKYFFETGEISKTSKVHVTID